MTEIHQQQVERTMSIFEMVVALRTAAVDYLLQPICMITISTLLIHASLAIKGLFNVFPEHHDSFLFRHGFILGAFWCAAAYVPVIQRYDHKIEHLEQKLRKATGEKPDNQEGQPKRIGFRDFKIFGTSCLGYASLVLFGIWMFWLSVMNETEFITVLCVVALVQVGRNERGMLKEEEEEAAGEKEKEKEEWVHVSA